MAINSTNSQKLNLFIKDDKAKKRKTEVRTAAKKIRCEIASEDAAGNLFLNGVLG